MLSKLGRGVVDDAGEGTVGPYLAVANQGRLVWRAPGPRSEDLIQAVREPGRISGSLDLRSHGFLRSLPAAPPGSGLPTVGQERAKQPALIGDGKVWTYGTLAGIVDDAAAELRKHGVRPGDRVMS